MGNTGELGHGDTVRLCHPNMAILPVSRVFYHDWGSISLRSFTEFKVLSRIVFIYRGKFLFKGSLVIFILLVIFPSTSKGQPSVMKKTPRVHFVCQPFKLSFPSWSACQDFRGYGTQAKKCFCERL